MRLTSALKWLTGGRQAAMGIAIAVLAACAGCGDDIERVDPVPLDKIPEAVMKAAREKLPDVRFETAYKGALRGEPGYELRGKNRQGKTREVEVSPEGKILGVE